MWKFFRYAFKWSLLAALALLVPLGLYTGAIWYQLGGLEKANPESTSFMQWKLRSLQKQGKKAKIDQRFVPYGEISRNLKEAVRKSEDPMFFEHRGFDWAEMRIAYENWRYKGKRLRGASTITMQTARLMFLSPARNPLRKGCEALITVLMEKRLSKERIFELYLNYADWGNGDFGAETAARRHFGKSCRNLSCSEAVALAAMLPSPDKRGPGSSSKAYTRHVRRLSRRMSCFGAKEENGPALKVEDEEENGQNGNGATAPPEEIPVPEEIAPEKAAPSSEEETPSLPAAGEPPPPAEEAEPLEL